MSVSRRMTAVLGMVTVILGAALVAAPSAQADTTKVELNSALDGEALAAGWRGVRVGEGRNACPMFYLCVWTGTNFTGPGLGITGTIKYGDGYEFIGSVWHNNIHSAVNKTTIRVDFYEIIERVIWRNMGYLSPGYDFRSGWPGANRVDSIRQFR